MYVVYWIEMEKYYVLDQPKEPKDNVKSILIMQS